MLLIRNAQGVESQHMRGCHCTSMTERDLLRTRAEERSEGVRSLQTYFPSGCLSVGYSRKVSALSDREPSCSRVRREGLLYIVVAPPEQAGSIVIRLMKPLSASGPVMLPVAFWWIGRAG